MDTPEYGFDIETDGLLEQMTTIHSLCMKELHTGALFSCTDQEGFTHPDPDVTVLSIEEGLKLLLASNMYGHNVIKFDIPAIQKIYPWFTPKREQVQDTLTLARLIYPEIRDVDFKLRKSLAKKQNLNQDELNIVWPTRLIGSQSLEAWGTRLGEWKGDYKVEREAELKATHEAEGLPKPTKDELTAYVWGTWNEAMQVYCDQDVTVTEVLYKKLLRTTYSAQAIELERNFAWIMAEMERNGFPFHMERANKLQHKLLKRKAEIDAELSQAFEPIVDTWMFTPKVNNSKLGYVKGVPIEKSETIIFNPSSRDHIARWLKRKYGWKPTAFTEQGKAKVDEQVLKKLKYPEAALLAESFLLDKRIGMLQGRGGKGLIPYGKSGRVHGSITTNGAVTRRCTHQSPNMAQLPATNVPYGREFRELMYAPEGWTLLGWDASGLELRCFAHYMARYDGGKYTDTVLSGDIHWTHVKALGLAADDEEYDDHNDAHNHARNKVAKRFIYAYLYGAGNEKIGEIVKPKASATAKRAAGKALTETFLKKTPALKKLKEAIIKNVAKNKGFIRGIDGGRITVRSDHAALNSLLQSAGAISVKLATILFYDKLVAQGLKNGEDFQLVAHVHDEVQTLVKKGLEDVVGKTAIEAMREAGDTLGFKCPLDAEYGTGETWADTH